MTDYKPVQDALASGADPAMLCTTCPWDRNCITPPSMTSAEVEAKIKKATDEDMAKAAQARATGQAEAMPVGSLLTALTLGGRDTSAQVCPVFALRLKSSGGRQIAESVRSSMQSWDDAS
jgi:hypothetical protein